MEPYSNVCTLRKERQCDKHVICAFSALVAKVCIFSFDLYYNIILFKHTILTFP